MVTVYDAHFVDRHVALGCNQRDNPRVGAVLQSGFFNAEYVACVREFFYQFFFSAGNNFYFYIHDYHANHRVIV